MRREGMMRGALLTLLGGMLWGFSGTCGQYLLQVKGLTSQFLVPIRLLCGGALLLALCMMKSGRRVFDVFKKDTPGILVFALLGMSMCQYTYYEAIAASNAGTATVLQYTGPVMIMAWTSLRSRKLPRRMEVLAIVLALGGTFLLATHGHPGSMALSGEALFWGLLSAVALAVYTVQPARMLGLYGSAVITGWGMLLGGVMLCAAFQPWRMAAAIDLTTAIVFLAVVVTGTAAYSAYMEGVRCVGAKKGSLYASVEPVSAAAFSAMLMGAKFTAPDIAGFVCILSTIVLLSKDKKE